MKQEYTLSKVGWLTNRQTIYIPPKTQEEVERIRLQNNEYFYKMFKIEVMFLQEKGLTKRTILTENDIVDDESKLTVEDLTEDGLRFYITGIQKWIQKLDRSKNRMEIVTDTSFLEKKYQEYVSYELPFFKKLLLEINDDRKILENKKKLTPLIEKVILESKDGMKEFFAKRSKKTTIDLMCILCSNYSRFVIKV